jgi:endonuclease-8
MPEGPEVAYLTYHVLNKYIGKTLKNIKINSGRYKNHGPPEHYKSFLKQLPLKCIDIDKKGKVIFFYFENDWTLVSKLGMTGWWFTDNNKPKWRDANTKNIIFTFNNIDDLFFSDFRNFGTITIVQDQNLIKNELEKLAPDVSNPKTKFIEIKELIEKNKDSTKYIEDVLIDQKIIFSGIGNYLKSEILYQAKISPIRKISSITLNEWLQIFRIGQRISKKMLKILIEQDIDKYMNAMLIYQKDYDPLGNKIYRRTTKQGRTTFYVPSIQK